jgi:outer membrane protein TolC
VASGLLAVAAVLLGGCVGQKTREEVLAREDLTTVTEQYRPREAKPPLPALTENSTLAELIQYALLNNPRVESTFYDWAAAVEEITTARSLPNPMLTFGATIGQGVPSITGALLTDPMNNWPGPGKLPLRAEAAYGESLKKRALFENELLTTALAVKKAYFQMWILEEKIRRTQEFLALVNDEETVARQRLAVGQVTSQDALRAQMERDRLNNDLVNLEDSRKPLAARLSAALGLGHDEPLPKLALRLVPTPPDFTEQSLLEIAFTRNPRLQEARSEVLQAMALFQLARKNTVPDYAFGVGVTGVGSPVVASPSFGITLPIWRDKIAAEVAQGQGNLKAAQARLSAEELDLAVRFAETAYAWRETDRAVSLFGERLLPKAKDALGSARAGYATGLSSFNDLQEAERRLLEYHLSHAEAVGQREIILAEMSLIVLGRWPESVSPVLPGPAAEAASEKQPPPEKN